MELEGYLYNSASGYLVIVQDGKSIELDDTLMRSEFIGKEVKIIIEYVCDITKSR